MNTAQRSLWLRITWPSSGTKSPNSNYFSKRGNGETLTNVDLPIPLGPRIPMRDWKSIPKLMSRKRMRSGVYLKNHTAPGIEPEGDVVGLQNGERELWRLQITLL